MPTALKTYLGDGVYADFEHGSITLTTENGIETTNTIVLEPQVYFNLTLFIKKVLGVHSSDG